MEGTNLNLVGGSLSAAALAASGSPGSEAPGHGQGCSSRALRDPGAEEGSRGWSAAWHGVSLRVQPCQRVELV